MTAPAITGPGESGGIPARGPRAAVAGGVSGTAAR